MHILLVSDNSATCYIEHVNCTVNTFYLFLVQLLIFTSTFPELLKRFYQMLAAHITRFVSAPKERCTVVRAAFWCYHFVQLLLRVFLSPVCISKYLKGPSRQCTVNGQPKLKRQNGGRQMLVARPGGEGRRPRRGRTCSRVPFATAVLIIQFHLLHSGSFV